MINGLDEDDDVLVDITREVSTMSVRRRHLSTGSTAMSVSRLDITRHCLAVAMRQSVVSRLSGLDQRSRQVADNALFHLLD